MTARPRRPATWTVGGLAVEGRRRLHDLPGVNGVLEARILLRRVLDLTDLDVLAFPERPVPAARARRFFGLVERRTAREPFAYIIGEKEFWSIPLDVGPSVLIPRPETETLVGAVLELAGEGSPFLADIGTGSGAVAVALAIELREARIAATDISRAALRTARRNAARHGLTRIEFLAGDLCAPLRRLGPAGRLDVLASNPPYVREAEWLRLEPEVRDHEPKPALVSGPTGLEIVRRLVDEAPVWLKPGGWLAIEIGRGQGRAVRSLLRRGWTDVRSWTDLRGIERVIGARRA